MHDIEPYYSWLKVYDSTQDERSPFYGKEHNYNQYSENIYGYYIDPAWDFMGSETLYIKLLYVDYERHYAVIEFIGEWNDALNNDIMHLKRNIVDHFNIQNINKYILIGENVLNFHGSDDSYYEEWFDEMEEGWMAAINFPWHVTDEWKNFNVDSYINFGGELDIHNWRALKPIILFEKVDSIIHRRISLV